MQLLIAGGCKFKKPIGCPSAHPSPKMGRMAACFCKEPEACGQTAVPQRIQESFAKHPSSSLPGVLQRRRYPNDASHPMNTLRRVVAVAAAHNPNPHTHDISMRHAIDNCGQVWYRVDGLLLRPTRGCLCPQAAGVRPGWAVDWLGFPVLANA